MADRPNYCHVKDCESCNLAFNYIGRTDNKKPGAHIDPSFEDPGSHMEHLKIVHSRIYADVCHKRDQPQTVSTPKTPIGPPTVKSSVSFAAAIQTAQPSVRKDEPARRDGPANKPQNVPQLGHEYHVAGQCRAIMCVHPHPAVFKCQEAARIGRKFCHSHLDWKWCVDEPADDMPH